MKTEPTTGDWISLALWTAGGLLLLGLLALAGYCGFTSSDVGACVRGVSFRVVSLLLYFASFGFGYAGAKLASVFTRRQWVIAAAFWLTMMAWTTALAALGFPFGEAAD